MPLKPPLLLEVLLGAPSPTTSMALEAARCAPQSLHASPGLAIPGSMFKPIAPLRRVGARVYIVCHLGSLPASCDIDSSCWRSSAGASPVSWHPEDSTITGRRAQLCFFFECCLSLQCAFQGLSYFCSQVPNLQCLCIGGCPTIPVNCFVGHLIIESGLQLQLLDFSHSLSFKET